MDGVLETWTENDLTSKGSIGVRVKEWKKSRDEFTVEK